MPSALLGTAAAGAGSAGAGPGLEDPSASAAAEAVEDSEEELEDEELSSSAWSVTTACFAFGEPEPRALGAPTGSAGLLVSLGAVGLLERKRSGWASLSSDGLASVGGAAALLGGGGGGGFLAAAGNDGSLLHLKNWPASRCLLQEQTFLFQARKRVRPEASLSFWRGFPASFPPVWG